MALPARLIREDYDGNPFLAEAYLGRSDFALASQLYFLFSRLSQLNLRRWPTGGSAVSDYGFCQDAIYAGINLDGDDLAVYRRLAAGADMLVKAPDVLIHLDAPVPVLMERIAERGRGYEKAFDANFVAAMRDRYAALTAESAGPIITLDVSAVDLRTDPAVADVARAVREKLR